MLKDKKNFYMVQSQLVNIYLIVNLSNRQMVDKLKPLFYCVYANIRKLLVDETIPLECNIIGLTRHRKNP